MVEMRGRVKLKAGNSPLSAMKSELVKSIPGDSKLFPPVSVIPVPLAFVARPAQNLKVCFDKAELRVGFYRLDVIYV